jgi:hypothetical protein
VIRRDERISVVLDQARKLRLAVVLAHQRLGQMTPPVLNALFGSTSIKFAANLADSNAAAMARNMATTTDFLQNQPKYHFAAHVRGMKKAVSLKVPFTDMGKMEQMTDAERAALRDEMRRRYAFQPKDDRESSGADHEDDHEIQDDPKSDPDHVDITPQ